MNYKCLFSIANGYIAGGYPNPINLPLNFISIPDSTYGNFQKWGYLHSWMVYGTSHGNWDDDSTPMTWETCRHDTYRSTGLQGLVNVPFEHHPTIGDTISNRYGKVMFKIPKKVHLPTPAKYG